MTRLHILNMKDEENTGLIAKQDKLPWDILEDWPSGLNINFFMFNRLRGRHEANLHAGRQYE
jgi:hypothetical protein